MGIQHINIYVMRMIIVIKIATDVNNHNSQVSHSLTWNREWTITKTAINSSSTLLPAFGPKERVQKAFTPYRETPNAQKMHVLLLLILH